MVQCGGEGGPLCSNYKLLYLDDLATPRSADELTEDKIYSKHWNSLWPKLTLPECAWLTISQ